MNEEEIRQYIIAKRNPISNCADLNKYFIGRHKVLPVYLTPQFEREFNSKMAKAEELKQENQKLKEQLQQKEDIINKAKEYNKQIIKDTKDFYRPTSDRIYSGDCLIDLAEKNIKILDNKGE